MNQKTLNILFGAIIVILIGAVVYFVAGKNSQPADNQPIVTNETNNTNTENQNNTAPASNTNAEVKMKTYSFTTSANNQIKFQYPDSWTVGKFAHYPQQLTLQPSDSFKAEATSKAINMSITGHCMNTQCLTVFSLDDMVREQDLKVISTAKVKGATGYYVKTNNGNAYVFIVGDDYITFSTDIYQTWLTKIVQTLEITQQTSWKDSVYNQFKNLANWKVEENISDWRLVDLDRSQLNKYSSGKIFYISKSFNEKGFPGPDVDQQMNQAASEQTALENSVKKTLTDNGWKFVAGPSEGGFYHDYLYVKDNHPLILQVGTRNAVTGGMYIAVEFQY